MKTKTIKNLPVIFSLAIVFLLTTASCGYSSDMKKEKRNVDNFNGISLSIAANLYLTQGSGNEVIIEADEDVLAKIETEVKGGNLSINFEKWYNHKGTGKVNIYITVKDIQSLSVTGSGDIIAKSAIKTSKMSFMVSGSGSIMIDDFSVSEVSAMITGSGDIKISGKSKANELDITITGSGDFDSAGLEFGEADLSITGSGSINAYVSKELDADITGSGKIYYKGKPVIDADITGSGKIKKSN